MTLKVESKIHNQPSVASEIGAAHGIRIRKRASDLPRKRLSNARARTLPRRITVTCEISVNTNVLRNARWKTGLEITFLKFWSPTNEKSRLPADELVSDRNTASRNGKATSRTI